MQEYFDVKKGQNYQRSIESRETPFHWETWETFSEGLFSHHTPRPSVEPMKQVFATGQIVQNKTYNHAKLCMHVCRQESKLQFFLVTCTAKPVCSLYLRVYTVTCDVPTELQVIMVELKKNLVQEGWVDTSSLFKMAIM